MKTIQVYDPPMCCSTGICGTDIDPDIVSFAAMLAQIVSHGVKVERYNLGQQPMAFVQNPAVKAFLEKEGADALPLIFCPPETNPSGSTDPLDYFTKINLDESIFKVIEKRYKNKSSYIFYASL